MPSQVSKPRRLNTGHRIEDERLHKALKKAVTKDQVEQVDWQEKNGDNLKQVGLSLNVSHL